MAVRGRSRVVRGVLPLLVVIAAAVPVVALTAAPARANCGHSPAVEISTAPDSLELEIGGAHQRLTATVRNNCPEDEDDDGIDDDGIDGSFRVTFTVPLSDAGVKITDGSNGCHIDRNRLSCHLLEDQGRREFYVRLSPPAKDGPSPAEPRTGQGEVRVEPVDPEAYGNGYAASAEFEVTLRPGNRVDEVSGQVVDSETSEPVRNAVVRVLDGDDREHKTATNSDGEFWLRSTGDPVIAAGNLRITVVKDGYDATELYQQAEAGKKVTGLRITLQPKPEPAASQSATGRSGAAGREDSGSWLPWLLVVLGAMALVASTVAIILLLRHRAHGLPRAEPDPALPAPPLDAATLIDVKRHGLDETTVPTRTVAAPQHRRGRHALPGD